MGDRAEDPLGEAVMLTASAPVFIAGLERHRHGLTPVAPNPGQTLAEDFLSMLRGQDIPAADWHAFQAYLVTVADHGMNASTFTARVVASTDAGLISAAVAALCALKGPLHGGAPGPVLDMLDEMAARGSGGDIEGWLEDAFSRGDRLMGFGHRIYRARDPRADVLKAQVARLRQDSAVDNDNGICGGMARLAFAERVESAAREVLAARYPNRRLDTNVEFYTALLLEAVGLPRALLTPAFAMGRVLGWIAHAREEQRDGRLIRPASSYIGPLPDDVTPLAVAG